MVVQVYSLLRQMGEGQELGLGLGLVLAQGLAQVLAQVKV
jgi:hypothetical protein